MLRYPLPVVGVPGDDGYGEEGVHGREAVGGEGGEIVGSVGSGGVLSGSEGDGVAGRCCATTEEDWVWILGGGRVCRKGIRCAGESEEADDEDGEMGYWHVDGHVWV